MNYVYKKGVIRDVAVAKYKMILNWLKKIVPNLRSYDLNRTTYQQVINNYAITHEKQNNNGFSSSIKGSNIDAIDEGLLNKDPTRKIIFKAKNPRKKKPKFLNQFELQLLIKNLDLQNDLTGIG